MPILINLSRWFHILLIRLYGYGSATMGDDSAKLQVIYSEQANFACINLGQIDLFKITGCS